jgi:hypothetical protein
LIANKATVRVFHSENGWICHDPAMNVAVCSAFWRSSSPILLNPPPRKIECHGFPEYFPEGVFNIFSPWIHSFSLCRNIGIPPRTRRRH